MLALEKERDAPYRPTRAGLRHGWWLNRANWYSGLPSAQAHFITQCLDLNLTARNLYSSSPDHRITAGILATSHLAAEIRWEEAGSLIRDAVKLRIANCSPSRPRVYGIRVFHSPVTLHIREVHRV